ncbi:hypothetical protein OS242_10640 [Tumebacillus sp. DT12]|uniref:Holin n=1 Tax=Tumebacillus lacus TaxID=2995335 RepID=A0ABT3X0K0_9BACL|nr:hypothetical protein [Tumebacillus lacus]MCX7570420.1 hypothetical protein [Tumebacillus lacus]
MKEKLKSRKMWAVFVTGLLIVANDAFQLGMSEETVKWIGGLAGAYILGQSGVDAVANLKGGGAK